MNILKENGYKIVRNEKREPKEKFFSVPPTLPDVRKGFQRFVIGSVPHQTGKAYLIVLYDKQYWLPKSKVTVGLDHRKVYVVDIPEWMIKAKGIPM